MRKPERTLVLTAIFVATLLATSTLYARDDHGSSGSIMRRGMMGESNMMGRMSQMMDHCTSMMQSRGNDSARPNEQWRKRVPTTPEKGS